MRMSPFRWLRELLFGCSHQERSGPFPHFRLRPPKGRSHFYQCCLDCGKEIDYKIDIFSRPKPKQKKKPHIKAGPVLILEKKSEKKVSGKLLAK